MSKSKERAKSLVKELVKRVREKFEKFVNNHDPSVVIIMSIVVIIWSIALLIVLFSMLFGFLDIIRSNAFYIVITPVLPFVFIAFRTLVEIVFKAIVKVIVKFLEKLDERATRYAEKRQAKNRESHFTKVAKKIDDDTLDLILKRSQIFSISIWSQFAACVMSVLVMIKEPYDGNAQKALIRYVVPITTYGVGLILFCIYEYFDRVRSAKCKLNDEKDDVENEC